MCGICGVVSLEGPLEPRVREAVRPMADAIRHRGPDGEGFFSDGFAAIGHRRLAIIDRARGAQPLANEDETCWIVFNGEVYNHRALRHELTGRGHTFRTHSDTETIVHAYEEFGEECVDRLEGMFAFAIWDSRRRELFIARDRLGKKPLFYASLGGVLHFASEIKSIAASPLWNDQLNLENLEGYLSLGYSLAPQTIYRHVLNLEPGCCLTMRNGHIRIRRYWDVPAFDRDARPAEALVDVVEDAIRKAVVDRLESEVPLGAFLSGGIDSGLVVSFAAEALPSVTTSTVGFAEAAHNELRAARMTADHFQTDHTWQVIEPSLDDVLDPIVRAFDEPFADPSAIPTYYVSQVSRRSVTVALSGDGGDEAFGGYDFRYLPHARDARLRSLVPGQFGRGVFSALGAAWPRHARMPRPFQLHNVLENLGRDEAAAYYADLCFLKPYEARQLLGAGTSRRPEDSPVFEAVTSWYRKCPSTNPVQRAEYADAKVYLPNGPLVKVDRMSMAHSLEIRCPLLDHRIIELGFSIPVENKMPGMQPKHLLRSLAARRLPSRISTLPKRGFTAPIGEWIRGVHNARFRSDVLGRDARVSDWLDQKCIRTLADAHFSGAANHWHALWAVWVLERWLRQREPSASRASRAGAA